MLYLAPATVLGKELDWFEIVDILGIEEHVPYNCFLLVSSHGVACQENSFQYDFQRIWIKRGSKCNQSFLTVKHQQFVCRETDRQNRADQEIHLQRYESVVLRLLIVMQLLTYSRFGREPSEPDMELKHLC